MVPHNAMHVQHNSDEGLTYRNINSAIVLCNLNGAANETFCGSFGICSADEIKTRQIKKTCHIGLFQFGTCT